MFTVYSKVNCPYCVKIEKVFKMKNLDYTKYTLDEDFNREDFIKKFGKGSTFPRVLKEDGELIGGASETVAYLRTEGLV